VTFRITLLHCQPRLCTWETVMSTLIWHFEHPEIVIYTPIGHLFSKERETPSSSFQIAKKTFKRHFPFPSYFIKILILNVKTNTIINFIIVVLHGHPTAHKARITKQNGGTISFATNHSFWGPSKSPMWAGFGIWQWVEPMQVGFRIFYWGGEGRLGWGVASG
jgi:hypothetical protein